jgi:23S rRNA (adenine2030-N6)-methyltransferase
VNYRHGYHAGNFADVVKHLALVAVLLHLRKKEKGFAVLDSHAGRGLYDLSGQEACRTGEAQAGIARLQALDGELPPPLAAYLRLVAEAGADRYPGSPLIGARLLRPQDRLVAIEKHPEEFAALKDALAGHRNATAEHADGHARLLKLLPPRERRGLILMDPPFESPDEFETLAQTARAAWRKFETGIYLIWYPVKSQAAADAFIGEVLAVGVREAVVLDAGISAAEGKLARAGLLVLNPPWGFEAEMDASARVLAPALDAEIHVRRVAGEG